MSDDNMEFSHNEQENSVEITSPKAIKSQVALASVADWPKEQKISFQNVRTDVEEWIGPKENWIIYYTK